MSWAVFAITLWLGLGFDVGLRDALAVGQSGAAPRFVMVFLAFIAASAPKEAALWAGLATGLALDVLDLRTSPGGGLVTTIGPNALGCATAAYAVVLLRASVMRKNPLALPMLAALATFLAGVVSVAILQTRSLYDPSLTFGAGAALVRTLFSALLTAALALPLGPLLLFVSPLFGFQHSGRVRTWRS
jgi:rod shape-determining protein MreD